MFFVLSFSGVFFSQNKANAYGECSEYGMWAMHDILTDSCKCMSGYIFGKDFLGQTTCVSGDSACRDKYGYNSRYDSLDGSCECSFGYVFGKDSIGRTQCVSPDSVCTDQLGYNATYNSLNDTCECRWGYVISGGKCTNGDNVCHTKHGLYSSYDELLNSCECDSGYTLDADFQCVKKQNNVYFKLLELDSVSKEAIIRSEYDGSYYRIKYNSGCSATTFGRYLKDRIVVNLGTDFSLDSWDKIVLQDDDETCDIIQKTKVDSSETLVEEEEEVIYYNSNISPGLPNPKPSPVPTPTQVIPKVISANNKAVSEQAITSNVATSNEVQGDDPQNQSTTSDHTSSFIESGQSSVKTNGTEPEKISWLKRILRFLGF